MSLKSGSLGVSGVTTKGKMTRKLFLREEREKQMKKSSARRMADSALLVAGNLILVKRCSGAPKMLSSNAIMDSFPRST